MWSRGWAKAAVGLAVVLIGVWGIIEAIPLSTLINALPPTITLSQPTGSVWSGEAAQCNVSGIDVGQLSWSLEPLSLLVAEPAFRVVLTRPDGVVRAEIVRVNDQRIDVNQLTASLTLSPTSVPVPVHAQVDVNISSLEWLDGALARVSGEAHLRQLTAGDPPVGLGDYTLQMESTAQSTRLVLSSDQSSHPAQLELSLLPSHDYQLTGLFTLPPGVTLPAMAQALVRPDGPGRWRLELSGRY